MIVCITTNDCTNGVIIDYVASKAQLVIKQLPPVWVDTY